MSQRLNKSSMSQRLNKSSVSQRLNKTLQYSVNASPLLPWVIGHCNCTFLQKGPSDIERYK